MLREQPALAGPVASDPVVSRLVSALAADLPAALAGIRAARAAARDRAWALASVGMTITEDIQAAIGRVPADAWTAACDGGGQVRDGAWVADITGLLDTGGWPAGMRVIVRRERPHPGAAAVHRHRRAPVHLLCHRYQARSAR